MEQIIDIEDISFELKKIFRKRILVTGCCGFIGFHLTRELLERGDEVIGIDNMNDTYSIDIKIDRLEILRKYPRFKFYHQNIEAINIEDKNIDIIVHLAAQAGVRYSIENPFIYESSNVLGTLKIFEFAKDNNIKSIIYASSCAVYGNGEILFDETQVTNKPLSIYGATKIVNELYAYVYHHLYGINMIGLRFFNVYGPWCRTDMALYKFTENIIKGKPIELYNSGKSIRDYVYIDDLLKGILSSMDKVNELKYEIINLGNENSVSISELIDEIEKNVGKKAIRKNTPAHKEEATTTIGDISKARRLLGFNPTVSFEEGIKRFVKWYKDYNINIYDCVGERI